MNELIPADDLYWDDDEKKHVAVSRDEENSLIRACLRCDLNEEQTLKIVQEYNLSKTSSMLFKHFIDGNIDIYSFSNSGEPIFSKPNKERLQSLEFLFFQSHKDLPENRFDEMVANSIEFRGGYLCCSYSLEDIPFNRIFDTVLSWCSRNGFDLLRGESPDDNKTWVNKDFFDALDREQAAKDPHKTWKVSHIESESYVYLTLEVGTWFELEERKDEH